MEKHQVRYFPGLSDAGSFTRAAAALEFAARCAGEGTLPELIAEFKRLIALFGYTASACGAWVGTGDQRKMRFFFLDWPRDWQELCLTTDWQASDFIIAEAGRRLVPFTWDEVLVTRSLSEKEAQAYEGSRAYGWASRFAVPIHGPQGYQALVTMESKETCRLMPEDRAALQIMAQTIHERCRAGGMGGKPADAVKLTAREIECMRWVAAGKTDWETAQVLGLAAATVHFHVERAKKKLNTKTRAQAVALLVLNGLL